jgi:hypothetical protein
MSRKADEFRAQARHLEERAETALDENIRSTLLDAARRWRELARNVERFEVEEISASPRERQDRQAVIAALSRAVRVYWDHEKSRPLPERLAQLAAAADEACNAMAEMAKSSEESPSSDAT